MGSYKDLIFSFSIKSRSSILEMPINDFILYELDPTYRENKCNSKLLKLLTLQPQKKH